MGDLQYKSGERIPGTKYRIVSLLGVGGYGEVYVAEHTFTEATVAVKLLTAGLVENADVVRRMHVEAKTLARLAHKNIVAVTDGGFTEEPRPRPYVVMELLKGASLEEFLARNPRGLGLRSTLKILPDVLDGLAVAHENGIIHRDLKPANIFVHTAPTGETYPKLLDFGIAHLISERRVTGEMYLGTPKWSAPEQLFGQRPTAQTDLYSMGLVVFHCLCGRGPFDNLGDPMAIARAHLKKPPPPISDFVQGAPAELERLVMAMLAKEPSARPGSAAMVAIALRKLLLELEATHEVTSAGTGSHTEPTPMQFDAMKAIANSGSNEVTFPDAPQPRRIVAAAEAETGGRGPLWSTTTRALQPQTTSASGRGHTIRMVPGHSDRRTATSQPVDRSGPTPTYHPSPVPPPTTDTSVLQPSPIENEDNVYMPLEAFLPAPPPPAPVASVERSLTPQASMSVSTRPAPIVVRARTNDLLRKYGVIAGGIAGVLLGLALIAILLAFQGRNYRADRQRAGASSASTSSDATPVDAARAR
jgi:serine/threonine-protein kinase